MLSFRTPLSTPASPPSKLRLRLEVSSSREPDALSPSAHAGHGTSIVKKPRRAHTHAPTARPAIAAAPHLLSPKSPPPILAPCTRVLDGLSTSGRLRCRLLVARLHHAFRLLSNCLPTHTWSSLLDFPEAAADSSAFNACNVKLQHTLTDGRMLPTATRSRRTSSAYQFQPAACSFPKTALHAQDIPTDSWARQASASVIPSFPADNEPISLRNIRVSSSERQL